MYVKCFIIVSFVVMGVRVMRLFSINNDVDGVDALWNRTQLSQC